jgi:3'-5' exoribonuclease
MQNQSPDSASSVNSENEIAIQPAEVDSDLKDIKNHKIFIKDFIEKQSFQSVFLARDKSVLTGKNSKAYMILTLVDKSGEVEARVWDNVEAISNSFQNGDMIKIKAQMQFFQNRKQVVIHKLEKADAKDFDIQDFINQSAQSPEEMYQQLMQIVETVQDRHLRSLILDTLNDAEIREKLLLAPAAKTIHHAYVGGLLEHILSISRICVFIASHYPQVKADYLIFGAIFHDLGKIWELEVGHGISYTDKGQLLGHMIMAVELVEKKASRIMGFPEQLKDLCKHIILSHHGKLEYGSPKLPMFLEAFIVAAIDDFDSKMNTISHFMQSESQSADKWSRFNQMFERYFYLKA